MNKETLRVGCSLVFIVFPPFLSHNIVGNYAIVVYNIVLLAFNIRQLKTTGFTNIRNSHGIIYSIQ